MAGGFDLFAAQPGKSAGQKAAPAKRTAAPAAKSSAVSSGGFDLFGAGTSSTKAAPQEKKSQNFLMKALSYIDKPRAAVVSTAAELGDALAGRGFSVNDIKQNIGRNYSVSDVLNESGVKLPGAAKFGLGLLGDVVLDPLTYAGGAGLYKEGAQNVARTLAKPEIIEKLAARGLTKEAVEQGARTAISGGVGRLEPKLAEALGEVTGKSARQGVYLRGGRLGEVRLPGTETLSRTLSNASNDIRKSIVNTGAGAKVMKALTTNPELRIAARNGDLSAWHQIESARAGAMARNAAKSKFARELGNAMKGFGDDKVVLEDVGRALSGDAVAAGRLTALNPEHGAKLVEMRQWFDNVADAAQLPKLENYFPRQWSDELKTEMKKFFSGGKRGEIPASMKRELVDGAEFMGETLRGATPAEILDDVERIARQRFGDDYIQVFSTDTHKVLGNYLDQASRRIAQNEIKEQLARRIGLAPEEVGVRGANLAAPGSPTHLPASTLHDVSAPAGGAIPAPDLPPTTLQAPAAAELARTGAVPAEAPRAVVRDVPAAGREQLTSAQTARASGSKLQVEELKIQRDALAQQFDAAQVAFDQELAGHRAAIQQGFPGAAPPVPARLESLQSQIRDIDTKINNLRGEAKAVQQEARADLLEAVRLEEIAGFESAPERAAKARLESLAAQQRASLGKPVAEGKVRRVLQNQTQLHNLVADSARKLVDGNNIDELADVLSRTSKLNTPEGMRSLLKGYDALNNFLKRYQIFSPGFHIRNAFGGEFNNWLAGVDRGAKMEWRGIWVKSKFGKEPERLSAAQREIFDWVEGAGTFGRNQATDVAGDIGVRENWNPFSQGFKPIAKSHRTSEIVEGSLRGELANHIRRQGGTAQDAFDAVAKFHFDYDDLTAFETGVVKRVIPFYTWTRKNLPLQLEQIAKQPGKYTAYLKVKQNLEAQSSPEDVVPGYFDDLLSIRLPKGVSQLIPGNGGNTNYIAPDLPFRDIGEYANLSNPGRAIDMIRSSVGVPIKLPLELQAGKKFFNDQPFYEGWSKAPGTWNAMPGLMPALALLGLADKGKDGYYMDQRDQYKVEQLMPVLARIRRMLPSGEGDEFLAERQMSSILSTNLGIGIRANTPAAQKAELKRRTTATNAAARRQRDLGYIP